MWLCQDLLMLLCIESEILISSSFIGEAQVSGIYYIKLNVLFFKIKNIIADDCQRYGKLKVGF